MTEYTQEPGPAGQVTRRQALAGAVGAGVAMPLVPSSLATAEPAPVANGEGAAGVNAPQDSKSRSNAGFRKDLLGVHPRLILGTAVSVKELRRRGDDPAYATFKADLFSIAESKPATPDFVGNPGNDGQWQNVWWWLPDMTMAWLLTGEQAMADKVRNYALTLTDDEQHPAWGGEAHGSAANSYGLMAIGLAYDWAHDLFDDAERAQIREKLRLQADRLYRAFYNPSAGGQAYWKHDYQANHHRNRIGGLMIATAAIHGDGAEDPNEDGRLDYARVQLQEVRNWISPDGTQHDGVPSYVSYGDEHIVRAMDIYELVTGTSLWNDAVFNMADAEMHMTLPGMNFQFIYGNGGGNYRLDRPSFLYYFNHYFWRIASKTRDGRLQAFFKDLYAAPGGRSSFSYNTWNMLWYDNLLKPEPYDSVPTSRYFSDLECVAARSGWSADDISVHFKCGPIGGHRLNQWRDHVGANSQYVNVAHDHADAGHFSLGFGGYFWGSSGPYRQPWSKYHNTIAVGGNDVGQAGERNGYFQPYADMRDRAGITEFVTAGADTIAIGEAAKAYQAPSSAGLERFNRNLLFVGGRYVVIIDDVVSSQAQDLTFFFHCPGDVAGDQVAGWTVTQTPIPDNSQDNRDPATLELYLPTVNGTQATVGAADHAKMGSTWRLTAAGATAATFVAVLYPQRDGESLQAHAPTVTQVGSVTLVTVVHADGSTDRIAVVGGGRAGGLRLGGSRRAQTVSGTGRVLLTSSDARGRTTRATVVGGTELTVPQKRQTSAEPSTLRWER